MHFAILIALEVETKVEPGLLPASDCPKKTRVFGRFRLNLSQDCTEVHIPDEDNDCSFRIAPGEVSKELSDLCQIGPRTIPEHTFCDEDVRLFITDKNVGLSTFVEGFSG